MTSAPRTRSLAHMKRKLWFILIATGLILLALGGWTVEGLRWLAGSGRARTAPAPA